MIWMYMKPTLQLYIHISNSVPSFIPAMYNVLPIAKRHSGIFLCHSILHVALHKHFVLTNGHVFFFWTILIPGCLFTTKFYYCFIYIELVSFFFLIWIKSLYPWPDTCTRWLVQHQDFWFKKSSSVIRDLVLDVSVYFKDYYCYL